MSKPVVSIITANYNSEKYIEETIISVQAQQFENWEMIIVDDASTDNSVSLVREYMKTDLRIRLIESKENRGPAATRNEGIAQARGKYITFIDSDDIWEPVFLDTMLAFMKEKEIDFAFASYYRKDETLTNDLGTFYVPQRVSYNDLLKTCPISCLTAIYDKESLGRTYMPPIQKRQDYGLWLALLKKTPYAYGYTQPLATYRIRKGSVSRNKWKAAAYQWKIYTEVEKLGMAKSLYYFGHYAVNGFMKYKKL